MSWIDWKTKNSRNSVKNHTTKTAIAWSKYNTTHWIIQEIFEVSVNVLYNVGISSITIRFNDFTSDYTYICKWNVNETFYLSQEIFWIWFLMSSLMTCHLHLLLCPPLMLRSCLWNFLLTFDFSARSNSLKMFSNYWVCGWDSNSDLWC